MKQSKKWLTLVLVCSQLMTTVPASASLVKPDDTIKTTSAEEQSPITPDGQESQPEKTPSEIEKPPVEEEVPVVPEVPETKPEESIPTPEPEEATTVEPPEEVIPTPVPKPDQSKNQETTKDSVNPAPVEKQRPSLAEVKNKQSYTKQISNFEITPVTETWDFIQKIGESAQKIGLEEDLYGSVMIAQAILESASGQSTLSQSPYHNLFGIKGTYEGNGVTFKTQEDDGSGNLYTIDATFRQYEDYKATFKDYAKLLKEGLDYDSDFYKGTWKSETDSYKDATEFLTGRYATDTQYGEKLNALIEAYALTSYDKEKTEWSEDNENMIYPIMDPIVSSSFGPRGEGFHRGVDFAAPQGTPILASLSGKVIRSEYHESWGNYIAIEHENGLTTLYAHTNQNLVSVGQTVHQGEIIASVGNTGNSTGPHLHFEVSLSPSLAQDQLIDPMTMLLK